MRVSSSLDIKVEQVKMEGAKGATVRWLISQVDGAPNFAMRMFELEPEGYSPLHTHPYEHEAYILEGEGVLVYEGKEYKFKKDYCVFVPPDKLHQFKNTGTTSLKFLCLIPHPKP
ncbi:cupin domain-containing protein [candidate division WOR-3 bacterium]|nr:cupin domain-containing protein [candidate division WOR-3 bacterium]